jgi:hypothetical protein
MVDSAKFVDPGLDSSTASSIAAQEAEFQAEEAEQAAQGNGLKPRQASQESTAAAAAAADQQSASQAAEAAAAAQAQAQAAAVQSSQQDQNAGVFKRSDSSPVDLGTHA